MKCLIFNTKEISFNTGRPANKPQNVKAVPKENDSKAFKNVSVVFTCVENGDTPKDAEFLADEIRRFYNHTKMKILIIPFAHLSNNIPQKDFETVIRLIESINVKLNREKINSQILGFGYDRSIIAKWLTILHKGNVVFRDSSFKSNQK